MSEDEAKARGYVAAKRGTEAAQRGTAEHEMVKQAQRPFEGQSHGDWVLAKVERTVGGRKRVDAMWIDHKRKLILVEDTFTGLAEDPGHVAKGWEYMNEKEIADLRAKGYRYTYVPAMKHPEHVH
jgi:hypothetical protein